VLARREEQRKDANLNVATITIAAPFAAPFAAREIT